jgi:hypothetical protein
VSASAGRRAALPGADELFRTTGPERAASAASVGSAAAGDLDRAVADYRDSAAPGGAHPGRQVERPTDSPRPTRIPRRARAENGPSGRERHEEKITVYVSGAELVDLERARLVLRAEHGLAVDRGRIVREALAVVLADLDAKERDSILVRRLRE